MAAAVSDFAQKQHIDMFAADPGLPELKLPETEPEPVEKILDMDESWWFYVVSIVSAMDQMRHDSVRRKSLISALIKHR